MRKALFTVGSINQTTQMHKISKHLPDYDCYFSQFFGLHWWIRLGDTLHITDNTIIGENSHFKKESDEYLEQNNLRNDYRGEVYNNKYDIIVLCADLMFPRPARKIKNIYVQEGMTDPLNFVGKIVNFLPIPNYWTFDTQLMGASNKPDIYCVASEGYKEHFVKLGADPRKMIVTGIPNYDNAAQYLDNDFPHKDYVLVATSDIRETFRKEDREAFLKEAVKIANGRQMIFKPHPNEEKERFVREVKANTPPETLIFERGNVEHMIANCEELITQYSTVVYTGIALGKKVHSYFDVKQLEKMTPLQNGGRSAERIADVIRNYVEFDGNGIEFLKQYKADWMLE